MQSMPGSVPGRISLQILRRLGEEPAHFSYADARGSHIGIVYRHWIRRWLDNAVYQYTVLKLLYLLFPRTVHRSLVGESNRLQNRK